MKIAIRGHKSRGKEVIQILESLGGKNIERLEGTYETFYYINDENDICDDHKKNFPSTYKLYTLEEFEKEFPFKIGDKVILPDYSNKKGTIISIEPCGPIFSYFIKLESRNGIYRAAKYLKPYKEMKKERNITLTLDKAKEWYNKGGELKEVALQAYSEEELTKIELPKTWEEFCENYPIESGESYINPACSISTISKHTEGRDIKIDRNLCPSKKSAEAHLAMIQLEQLRDCYRGLFVPVIGMPVWCIVRYKGNLIISQRTWGINETFLAFQSPKIAEEYLNNFEPLIEKAGDLI